MNRPYSLLCGRAMVAETEPADTDGPALEQLPLPSPSPEPSVDDNWDGELCETGWADRAFNGSVRPLNP